MHRPLQRVRPRSLPVGVLGAAIAAAIAPACQSASSPVLNEQWAADLAASRQVLYLTFPPSGSAVSGRGTLSGLLEAGSEALSIKGTRRADTLDVTLIRSGGAQHRLVALYVSNRAGLSGQLSGGEFDGLRVNFRKP